MRIGYSALTTPRLNETQIAENKIKDTFGSTNMVALVVLHVITIRSERILNELSIILRLITPWHREH